MEKSGGDGTRLPTFKCPRDLTLQTKLSPTALRSRKNFVPNIPPKRDRAQTVTATSSKSDTSPPKSAAARGRSRDKRPRPEFVQASSIFSEGVGDGERGKSPLPKAPSFRSARADGSQSAGVGERKTQGSWGLENSRVREDHLQGNLGFQEMHAKVHGIIGDGKFIKDEEEDLTVEESLQPVSLPLASYLETSLAEEQALLERTRLGDGLIPKLVEPLGFANSVATAPSDGRIVFIQFPDRIPLVQQTTGPETVLGKQTELCEGVGMLPEGLVGKIQILASGACRLVLGDNVFHLQPAKPVAFSQELAAMDLEKKTMTVLGAVKQKFLSNPEIDFLLRRPS